MRRIIFLLLTKQFVPNGINTYLVRDECLLHWEIRVPFGTNSKYLGRKFEISHKAMSHNLDLIVYRFVLYFFSFSKSRISVSKVSSLVGAGGAGGVAGASAFFLAVSLVSSLINKKIESAMIKKSNVACKKLP